MAIKTRVRTKLCGTTELVAAQHAITCGVDALGFIFAKKSGRYITPKAASNIIKEIPPFIGKVGVFVDELVEDVVTIVKTCGLTAVQLHGKESPEYCWALRERLGRSCTMVKAFRVRPESVASDFSVYETVVNAFLLDTYAKGIEGGTGEVFNWDIIDQLELQKPFILAGGLAVENIVKAINDVAPYAVDVNSGVEMAPGKKDPVLVREIMEKILSV